MYSLTQLEDKGIDQIYMKREALVLARSRYIMVWKNPTIILHLTSPRPLLISTAQTQHQQFAYQPFAYIFIHHPNPFFIDVNQFHFWNVAGKAPKSNKNSSFCTLRNFALRFGIEYNWSLESLWLPYDERLFLNHHKDMTFSSRYNYENNANRCKLQPHRHLYFTLYLELNMRSVPVSKSKRTFSFFFLWHFYHPNLLFFLVSTGWGWHRMQLTPHSILIGFVGEVNDTDVMTSQGFPSFHCANRYSLWISTPNSFKAPATALSNSVSLKQVA